MGTVLHGTADIPAEKSIQNGCPRKFEDQLMWIDIKEVLHYSCLKEYFSSNFNPDTGKWERLPGIEFSVPRWGSTYAVDDLVPNGGLIHISYYKQMIEKFESLGFVDGVNIFGAGFDWKESPSDKWVNDVKNLIESAYDINNQTKVTLVTHSMGCPYSLYALTKIEKENKGWIEKYIHMYVPMAPAWMGAVKAFDFMLEGVDFDLPIAGKYFAPLMRHLPSLWFLLPKAEAFPDMVLATSPSKTYTFKDMEELFNDGNLSYVEGKLRDAKGAYFDLIDDYNTLPYDKLRVRQFMGCGKDTVVGLNFAEDIKPHDPDGTWESCKRVTGDGDHTVPIQSLVYAPNKWAEHGYDVEVYKFEGVSHVDLIQNEEAIEKVIELVCETD